MTLKEAAAILNRVPTVMVLTGAGVSKESGIPTFRDALTGLWSKYDPERLATPEGFLANPPLVWQWYDYRRKMVLDAKPNPGHFAIAQLGKKKKTTVVTQNVDGLHQKAGSEGVIELHGNITAFFCFDSRHPAADVPFGLQSPPACTKCGSLVRPGVVWFGEQLPPDAISAAATLATTAGAVVVVGTSGLVQPAASLPFRARQSGVPVIEVNPEPTPISNIAEIFLKGPSGTVLPDLVGLLD